MIIAITVADNKTEIAVKCIQYVLKNNYVWYEMNVKSDSSK